MAFNLRKKSQLSEMQEVGVQPLDDVTSNINIMKAFHGFGPSMGYSTPYEMVNSIGYNETEAIGASMTSENMGKAEDTAVQLEQAEDTVETALPQFQADSKPFG